MKEATNISPIEIFEEGVYNTMFIISISLLTGSILLFSHIIIVHGALSYFLLTTASVSFIGCLIIPWWKSKRFGNKNRTLAERIVVLENAVGTAA